jgi:hypothetical protein
VLEGFEAWKLDELMTSEEPILRTMANILTSKKPLLSELRNKYDDLEQRLDKLLDQQETKLPRINPAMDLRYTLQALDRFEPETDTLPWKLLEILRDELANEESHRIWYDRRKQVVKVAYLKPLERLKGVPVLVLDATMNIDALTIVFPKVEHHKTPLKRPYQGPTLQVWDSPVSKARLLPPEKFGLRFHERSKKEKKAIEKRLIKITKQYGPGLIVSHLDYVYELNIPKGCGVAHFGGLRGSNDWENLNWVVVISRFQIPVGACEERARVYFGSEPDLLITGQLKRRQAGYRVRSGLHLGTNADYHVDERVQSFMWMNREAETEQAIDRLRLIFSKSGQHKPIFILSNLPLNIEIDRHMTFNEWIIGGPPLFQAWTAEKGVLPIVPKWLWGNYGHLLPKIEEKVLKKSKTMEERLSIGTNGVKDYLRGEKIKVQNVYNIYIYKMHLNQRYLVSGKRGRPLTTVSIWGRVETRRRLEEIHGPLKKLEWVEPANSPRVILAQTARSADRAVLDCAQAAGLAYSGWCGTTAGNLVPGRYPLFDADVSPSSVTKLNISHSDGVLIIAGNKVSRWAQKRAEWCVKAGRPFLVVTVNSPVIPVQEWLEQERVDVMFVLTSKLVSYGEARRFMRGLLGS